MENFKREGRYVVLKISDLGGCLSETEKNRLLDICHVIEGNRALRNKAKLECVVIESDWPEHEAVWKMIENRMSCEYCQGAGEIEQDNNGPIGPCPACQEVDEQWILALKPRYAISRGMFSRPDHRGYTNVLCNAGRFSEREANDYAKVTPDKYTAIKVF